MKRKSGFLTFICACVPGCGQMYLGYMKRGLSLAAFFWASIACSYFLRLDGMLFLMPVIWLYAFFDTYNIRSQTVEEHNATPDEYILGASLVESITGKNHKVIGWACIALGGVLLYNVVVLDLIADRLWNYFPFIASLLNRIPTLLVGLAIIWLGARFAFGPAQEKAAPEGDDFQHYTAPKKEPAAEYVSPFTAPAQPAAEEPAAQPAEPATEEPVPEVELTTEPVAEEAAAETENAAQDAAPAEEPKPKKGAKKNA